MTLVSRASEPALPRERLARNGPAALSDRELLALLIRTGSRGRSALDLARDLLVRRGGLGGLATLRRMEIERGLGPAKWGSVLAAVELGRRFSRARLPDRIRLDRPDLVADYLFLRYAERDQEVMGALFLDARQGLLGERALFLGTLTRAAVEPRPVFKEAVAVGAAAVILFHNHPSGDPSPSAEDWNVTRRIAAGGRILGIDLVDHLILGGLGRFVSLRRSPEWQEQAARIPGELGRAR